MNFRFLFVPVCWVSGHNPFCDMPEWMLNWNICSRCARSYTISPPKPKASPRRTTTLVRTSTMELAIRPRSIAPSQRKVRRSRRKRFQ
ncbi:MAG: hypothetical protein JKY61_12775 [Planctomycetes bacterium]|nr:hypothetical protein [Planctomycetota bacterium]